MGDIMFTFLKIVFIFFIGSTLGWIIELFFRRFYHGKWVNPGFLVGPYLPIYGFGLVSLTGIYLTLNSFNLNPVFIIILMGICMTIIELVGGIISLKNNVRLWDYRDRWLNYKGIICPLFSFIWTVVGGYYYYVLAPHVLNALNWFSQNLLFSFILGLFTGIIIIDTIYSTKLYIKIRKFAKENDIVVKYEQLKMNIREVQNNLKIKYSFIFAFKQTKSLKEYLNEYKEKYLRK